MTKYSRAICFVFYLGLALQGSAQSSPNSPARSSLSVRALQKAVKLGSPLTIEISITNTSQSDIFLTSDLSGGIAPFAVDIHDQKGNPLPKISRHKGEPRGGSFVATPIHPGETVKRLWTLDKEFAINRVGSYTIQVTREEHSRSGSVPVKSNRVMVDVLP
jgi:hypothetical protein